MRTRNIPTLLIVFLCSLIHISAQQNVVYRYEIHSEIGPSVARLTEKAVQEAEKRNAAYILVDLDTYGGMVDAADIIRTALLKTKIPTIAFVRNNAASAGALISIACDSIYMRPGATIGAASVVNQEGELMPEKYQSYMRKKMRATAEETGRNPLIAEGMTDENMEIDSIKEKGKIITFSTKEAIQYGYCNGIAETPEDAVAQLKEAGLKIENHKISTMEALILWLVNPAVSGILLLLIFGGIYLEFKTPGTFVPIALSAVAALAYFAPLYLEGLAANWEILVFAVGLILIIVEIFLLPGFGVAGILGIACTISGLTLAMVRNIDFDFSFVPEGSVALSFLMVTVAMAVPLVLLLLFGQRLFSSSLFRHMSVEASMTTEAGYTVKDNNLNTLLSASGIAATDLRPSGKVEINGMRHEAMADGSFLTKGTSVQVVEIRGNILVVEKTNS